MKHRIFFIFLLVGALACEQTLDRPLPEHTPRLVVYGFLSPGEIVDVYVSRSYGPLDELSIDELLIPDASLDLKLGSSSYTDPTYIDTIFFPSDPNTATGAYRFAAARPEVGQTVSLEVSHPDYETVSAQTVVPNPIEVVGGNLEQNAYREVQPDGSGEYQSLLHITVDDPADITNFYRVGECWMGVEDPNQPNNLIWEPVEVLGPAVLSQSGGYVADGTYASDESINGQVGDLTFLVRLRNAFDDPAQIQEFAVREVAVFTETADEAYARFQEDLDLQRNSLGGISLTAPEPIIVFSNIENGYGLLGGLVTSRDTLR
ncbi:MAG: DUF4249 domain-containing protein [Bacteroidota bacterium]